MIIQHSAADVLPAAPLLKWPPVLSSAWLLKAAAFSQQSCHDDAGSYPTHMTAVYSLQHLARPLLTAAGAVARCTWLA